MEADTTPMDIDADEEVPLAVSTGASTIEPDGISVESVVAEAAAEPVSSQSETQRPEPEAWGTGDDEDGWMPKPARLHSGKTRSCAVSCKPTSCKTPSYQP
ncbi:hypothetical protein JM18_006353 [Phytophthora kernoviae]|uniref:Uncharacterized protein n=1 Tax=Phytophthora kernoviae TaxID=325452 RepID=A0A8T0LT54_9STRA|nr:hypothetical protein JM16_006557 [Phytophthora kernoviae]KAG2521905.1 hypothetical protein JM18_006353 [Phytophthora kernoviae]